MIFKSLAYLCAMFFAVMFCSAVNVMMTDHNRDVISYAYLASMISLVFAFASAWIARHADA